MAGIYIHIPFCKQSCSYCDFFFSTNKQFIDPFVMSLVREIESTSQEPFTSSTIETLYIGGGTPSLLSAAQLNAILDAVHRTFSTELKEVTIEINPDDVTPEYLKMLLDCGIHRVSMGVQSFDEEILRFMNRAHNQNEAMRALSAIHETGFPSFTADLIYGNPGQTLKMLKKDILQLLEFNPPHISAYSLTVEPRTRLGKQVRLGRILPPDDEQVSDHLDLVRDTLGEHGMKQYEVSNYAIPGKEAVHNSNYWEHKNYLGFGPSAHSFYWTSPEQAVRRKNAADLKAYLNASESGDSLITGSETLQLPDLAEERLMIGLRTSKGISFDELQSVYHYKLNAAQKEWRDFQVENGTISPDTEKISFTREGLKIADLLIVDLLSKQ